MQTSRIRLGLACLFIAWLTGCASPANRQALVVSDAPAATRHPYSVSVSTSGGGETGSMDYTNISDEDLAGAIEESITHSGLFSTVIQGDGADYRLNVSLINMSKPMFGMDFKIDMEMAWSLIDARTGDVVMREAINSTHTATMGQAFAAVTRIRMAVEGAAQENIRQGLEKIAALKL
ncbi:MAG: hypothetical protein HKP57_04365 [Halobacteria archaeon]|nr:hypothetical protein [Halobacteria archaeon]